MVEVEPRLQVMLDKPYTLAVNANVLIRFEEASGLDLMAGNFRPKKLRDVRTFIWSALVENHPEITEEFLGSYMTIHRMKEFVALVGRMMKAELTPEGDFLAPFVPTPEVVVNRALELAGCKKGSTVCDLGCGEAAVLIQAVQTFGAGRGIGWEVNTERFLEAQRKVQEAGLAEVITLHHAKAQGADVSEADIVFLYLLTASNEILRPLLARTLRIGTRLVSHDFIMPGWEPYAAEFIQDGEGVGHHIYCYLFDESQQKRVGSPGGK